MNRKTRVLLATVAGLTLSLRADIVRVEVTGEVEYNQINPGLLGAANPGDPATLTFLIDSENFENSPNFPTRGYPIDQESFAFIVGPSTVPLQNPFPAGETPYFVIRNNDPMADGFLVATSLDYPNGVPLDQVGVFGNFIQSFYVTYGGEELDSLDVLDATGTYDFDGLTVFNWTVLDGPAKPMGLIFAEMTIEIEGGGCTADLDGSGVVDVLDLVTVILDWGCVPMFSPCPGNVNGDNVVDVLDLVQVILQWGVCGG